MEAFFTWWQHIPEGMSPYIIEIGPLRIGYYGLMYIVAFLVVYLLSLYRLKTEEWEFSKDSVENLLVWCAFGLLIGARLGYVLFYQPAYYLSHPLEAVLPVAFTDGGIRFTGISGMSYHGGAVGVVVSGAVFVRRHRMSFWGLSDFLAPAVPLAYTFGRLGNFINGELYGRATSVPWGMYFPRDPQGLLRHPSQLYEAFFEGIFLFAILWALRKKRPFSGFYFGLYLIGYGTVRFFIEFVREPDAHLGFVLGPLTMGQVLNLVMVAVGALVLALRRRTAAAGTSS